MPPLTAPDAKSLTIAIVGVLMVAMLLITCIVILISKQSIRYTREPGRSQPPVEPRTFLDDVHLGSLKSGVKLRIFVDGVLGFPIERFTHLAVVTNTSELPVESLDDLVDSVVITSESEALEYVRLLTNSDTRHLFGDNEWRGEAESGPVAADTDITKTPIVRKEDEKYIIQRFIVDQTGCMAQVIEEVQANGRYRLVSQ